MLVVRLQMWLQAPSGIFGTPGTGTVGLALWSERYVFCVHPRGLLSRACPHSPVPVPGECGLSPATTSTAALCNFGPLSRGHTSPEMPLWGCYPLFLYQGFFSFFLNPFKSLGRMAQCRERSCVTELRESHSPKNQYSCHSGCICWGGLLPL